MKYRFKTKPFEHQRRGLKRLWKQGSGALFWEPGTGKTKTALDYAAALHKSGKVDRVLILCPINAMQVWPDQMEKHLDRYGYETLIPEGKVIEKADQIVEWAEWWDTQKVSPIQFIILNYEATIKRNKEWNIMWVLEEYDADLLILDESQKVKSATTKRSKASHRLGLRARFVCLLSGTPISKNYLDLYSQLKVIDPSIWRENSEPQSKPIPWTKFRYRYGVWGGRTGYELKGYQNLNHLQDCYRPYISTARKKDCLDLPPVTDEIIPIIMNTSSRLAYDAMAAEGMVVWKRHLIDAPIILTKLLRLQEMTGGGIHDEVGEVVDFQMDKLNILRGLLEDLKEAQEKVIIFARFKWELNAIMYGLNVDLAIRGGVTHRRRKEVVQEFRKSKQPKVLLIQIAAGEALDGLQDDCSYAIFYSTDYSWDHYVQARGRLDRAGQENPVTFYHLHMVGTIDKLVYRALQEKKNLEKMVMDDPELLVVDRS